MNLFGIDISLAKSNGNGKSNGKYVKQNECYEAQDSIKDTFREEMEKIRKEIKNDTNSIHERVDAIFTLLANKK